MTTIVICKKKRAGFLRVKTNPDKIKITGKRTQGHNLSVIPFRKHAVPTVCVALFGASPSNNGMFSGEAVTGLQIIPLIMQGNERYIT